MGLLELGRALLSSQPFSVLLGAEITRFEPGAAEIQLPLRKEHEQQNGFVHGGVLSFLCDNAITFAGGSALGPEVLTQEFKVSYLRPGKGERLVARAEVVYSSKRQAVCRCDVFTVEDSDERLCATALGTVLTTTR